MIPVNLELVNQLWLPNIFIYNLKTFKVKQKQLYYWIAWSAQIFNAIVLLHDEYVKSSKLLVLVNSKVLTEYDGEGSL